MMNNLENMNKMNIYDNLKNGCNSIFNELVLSDKINKLPNIDLQN